MIEEKLNNKSEHLCVWKEPDGYMYFDSYFSNDKCRIFIITNIVHNYLWLKKNLDNIRENDYFLVYHWWFQDDNLARQSAAVIDTLKLNKSKFIPLCNDYKELQHFLYYGFENAIQFNQNAWLDENLIKIIPNEKIYDAILTVSYTHLIIKTELFLDNLMNEEFVGYGWEDFEFSNRIQKKYKVDQINLKGLHLYHELSPNICLLYTSN